MIPPDSHGDSPDCTIRHGVTTLSVIHTAQHLSFRNPSNLPSCNWLASAISVVVLVSSSIVAAPTFSQTAPEECAAVIDEVWDIVESEFYDPLLRGLDASAIRAEYQQRAREAHEDQLPELVNDMLGRLDTSHTVYLSRNMPGHYRLLGIFEFLVPDVNDPRLVYEGICSSRVQNRCRRCCS
jgi:hypothetical protein